MSFTNKVVLVVGASSGIGAATAIAFVKEGANVAIVGRNEEKLKNVSNQCEKVGKKPLILKADISNDDEVKMLVAKTVEVFEKLDILINNASILRLDSVLSGNILHTFDEVIKTNLRGVVHVTGLAAPHLVKTKGNIINISSVSASFTRGSHTAQSCAMSKAALNHFTRLVATELAPLGVRVNTISPGPVNTDMLNNAGLDSEYIMKEFMVNTALHRISQAEEIADLILFIASDKAKAITGSELISDNGMLLSNNK